ncbi:MAG: TIGR02530 family flagellar biosynthesis protein [Bdellovibrionota bacterium]
MDLKKIQGFEKIIQPSTPNVGGSVGKGPSFKDTLDQVGQSQETAVPKTNLSATEALKNIADGVKFSNHAIDRMRSRGISFKPEDMTRLNEAVGRAASKGSKDSLILMNDSALIVSVKNKTVVTVMDKSALKENVFTNIDSTIVM